MNLKMKQQPKRIRSIALKALLVVAGLFSSLTGFGQVRVHHAAGGTDETFTSIHAATASANLRNNDIIYVTSDINETTVINIVVTSSLASGSKIYIQSNVSGTRRKVDLQPFLDHPNGHDVYKWCTKIDGINVEFKDIEFVGYNYTGKWTWDANMFNVNNAEVTFKNCYMHQHDVGITSYANVGTNGACVCAKSNSTINIDENTIISSCTVSSQPSYLLPYYPYNYGLGGAVYVDNSTLEMEGTIRNCTAGMGGGAIHAAGTSTVNMSGKIHGCSVNRTTSHGAFNGVGGGLSVEGAAKVYVTGEIYQCTTVTYGGAIGFFGTTPKLGNGASVNGFPTLTAEVHLLNGSKLSNCSAVNEIYTAGGGVFCDGGGKLYMEDGATITGYTSTNRFMVGTGVENIGTFYFNGGTITNNVALTNGNGCGIGNETGGTVIMKGTASITNCKMPGGAGGAIFNVGTVIIQESALIQGNQADGFGGAIHNHNGGTLTIEGGTVKGNICPAGGGISNFSTFNFTAGEICENVKSTDGAGVRNAGTMTMSGTAKIYGNQTTSGSGAGVANSGSFTFNAGEISNNTAGTTGTGNGGGVISSGILTINGGSIYNNSTSGAGGGVFINGNSSTATMTAGSITGNSAATDGGGIYNSATFNIQGGNITSNTSTNYGNGIYQNGTMNLSGSPVFGTNDVYLPCNKTLDNGSGTNRVITKNGNITMSDGSLHVTLGNNASNLYTGRNILETGSGNVIKDDLKIFVFENQTQIDAKTLVVFFTQIDATTSKSVIELSVYPTWVTVVTSQPTGFLQGGVPYIDSKEDLAWLISYVTGYNGATPQSLSGKTIILAADLDMDEHIWVPIGSKSHPFEGTFNGNGCIIKGLRNVGNTTGEEAGFDYPQNIVAGLFGYVSGNGTIKNTFVEDCNFEAKKNGGYYGIIADTITGSAIVHSSEVMGTLNATNASAHIGGLVGLAQSGTEVHSAISFATLTGGTDRGGVVNKLDGAKLNNSFCKFTSFDTGKELCATNSGAVANCYYVNASTQKMNDGTAFTVPSTRPYQYGVTGCMAVSRRMIDKMNAWVASNGATKYAQWAQPITAGVNYDCPVLKLKDFNSMACKSGSGILYIYYNADLDAQLRDNNMATIFFYGIKEGSTQSYSGNGLYIDQDAALTGTGTVNAHTSRLLDNAGADYWHLYSSPLADAPLGFSYGQSAGYLPEVADPCSVSISGGNVLPSNTPTSKFDFYAFYEPQYHWVNFKRKSDSHWHMDGEHANIAYTNEPTLTPGKGYLVALEDLSYLQSAGTLNKGNVTINVTADAGNELKGYNLIGNPYQSYLSFAGFAEVNPNLWSGTPSFAVYDAETDTYIPGSASTPSSGSYASTGDINIHQGFFIVKTGSATTATFNESMRSVKPADGTHFRGERPAFPLINLKATGADGTGDIAVVEFGRPEFEGAAKMKNIGGNGKVYFRYGDEDYAVLYMDREVEQLPLYFETTENATYTLTWNTANATFNQLHLIDNLTGLDIDMLSSEGYSFTAKPDDYKSRFRLVFEYNGIEEESNVEPAETFAFFSNGNLIVNGEGHLEVIDMQGRVMKSTSLTDTQNTLSLPEAAHGIYMLKLTSNNNVRIQKIIVR